MSDQHCGADQGGGDPPKKSGVPGLRVPPGFENLASSQGTEAGGRSAAATTEENPSSTSPISGADVGIFPFPAARASSPSPPSAAPSDCSDRSTLPEVSSDYSDREKMEATNAFFFGHHHQQMVATMNKKFQDLLDYDKTKNCKILHIDWIVGNPADPIKEEGGESSSHGGMSAEDRRLSESVARSVMKITFEVPQWDETETWNKSLFYGDWLNDHKGFRQFFVEIQVKRISGADDALLEKCGISPEFVWLSLHDDKAPAVTPIIVPPIVTRPMPILFPHECFQDRATAWCDTITEEEEHTTPAPTIAMEVPDTYDDKGKSAAVAPQGQASGPSPINASSQADRPVIVSSDSHQSPQRRLPSVADLALSPQLAARASPLGVNPGSPQIGIPRSQPLPATGSFNSIELPQCEVPVPSCEPYQQEGTIYLNEGDNPFENLIPAHQAPIISAADLHRHRQEFDRNTYAKREELSRIFAFTKDPAFIERKNKSFVYTVRIIAMQDRSDVVNVFTGPRVADRYSTHIAQGGWVVPPLEERIKWRDEHKRAYRNKGAKLGKYDGIPRAQVQHAMPAKLDWSGYVDPRYFGPAAPVWREVTDPTLEDVYWMVWQLLSGKQYLGFRSGTGFGVQRRDPAGEPEMLNQCPFKSPSTEALYHSASYPRGKET